MQPFTKLTGVAAPLPIVNVDTDMIIPKDYLKTIKRTGLGTGLFAEMRYNDDGSENPDFVLNKPAYRKAQILVAGDNFGCGSSREHAPWALLDFGIRCVISTASPTSSTTTASRTASCRSSVSPGGSRQADGRRLARRQRDAVDRSREPRKSAGPMAAWSSSTSTTSSKHCLLNGLDDIGLTMEKAPAIDAFEKKIAERAWA